MATPATLERVKTDLRIKHTALDDDLKDTIDACLLDLKVCGVKAPDESDALIINCIKLFSRANYTDDTSKAAAYMERYNSVKACLMMATGYGGEPRDDED